MPSSRRPRPLPPARRDTLTHSASPGHHRLVTWRRKNESPITRDEVSQLILMLMRMDWKQNLILDEMDIDHGQAQY